MKKLSAIRKAVKRKTDVSRTRIKDNQVYGYMPPFDSRSSGKWLYIGDLNSFGVWEQHVQEKMYKLHVDIPKLGRVTFLDRLSP